MKLRMSHVRKSGMCARGVREFFRRHDLNWSDFLKNGIDEKIIAETNDAMAMKVIEVAHGRTQ